MSESTLAYTVHHKGRKYLAGLTADEVGPVAGELGDHLWVDGKAPAKVDVPGKGTPDGGVPSGTPVVPTPSALPGPVEAPEPDDAAAEAPARRATGRRSTSS